MPDAHRARGWRSLPPVVRALGAVSFLNDLASEMVYPLLPQLVTRGLGAGAFALGALDGVSDAVSAFVKLASGWLSDHPRWRRPLIVGGYLVAAVTRPLTGLAGAAWQVIGLRAADRVGKGARNPPRDAVIADAVVPGRRGRAFGFHRAMDHAGATVGPLVAGGLMATLALDAGTVILWSIVPGVLAVGLAAVALRRVVPVSHDVPRADGAPLPGDAPPSASLIWLVLLVTGVRMPEALFLLRLQDVGVAPAMIPVLWSALHVVRTAASYPGGWLSDRAGPGRTMLIGWFAYALVAASLALVGGPVSAGVTFLGLGVVSACTESPERALVAAWGGRERRGRGFGLYHAGVGIAALPGGLALGALYQLEGGTIALAGSAGLTLLLCVVGGVVLTRGA